MHPAGIGTAGVPAGSLPVIALNLDMVGVPPAAIGIVCGVYHLPNMCRTMLDVTRGLSIATMVNTRDHFATAEGPA